MANNRARALRANMTEPERKLWRALRGRQVDGHRFRRQHPLGPFIVDFVCLEKRLVIEVDGGQHGEELQQAVDARRSAWLAAEGYRVVRVWNGDVIREFDGVLMTIWAELRAKGRGEDVER